MVFRLSPRWESLCSPFPWFLQNRGQVLASRSFSAAFVREEPLGRPHLTITLSLLAAFSKMPPKMERNMWKKMPCGSRRLRSTFCEVSCLRRSGLREYLLSNRLLLSELKLKSKSCSEVHAFLYFLQQKFCGAASHVFASVTGLSAVSLAADPYSAPSLLPSALKAPFWLLPLPSEGGYLAAQMQMKLLDLVEGIRWH